MTAYRHRLISLITAVILLVSLLPVPFAGAESTAKYGMTTDTSVNVRYGAATNAKKIFQIPQAGYVAKILKTVTGGGYEWYQVEIVSPENQRTYTGYIMKDFFRELTEAEAASYEAGNAISESGNSAANINKEAESGTTGVVTASGVNLRVGPGKNFQVITQLNRGTVVELLEIPSIIDQTTFYKIQYAGMTGYMMSTYIQPSSGPIVPTPTPTPAPYSNDIIGYVQTTKGGVNLRATPGGTVITMVGKYEVYPYLLEPVSKGGYTWYFVQAGPYKGYLRSDCVKKVTEPEITATPTIVPVTPTPEATGSIVGTPTPTPYPTVTGSVPTPTVTVDANITGYVKTNATAVALRVNAGYTNVINRITIGTVMPYYGPAKTVRGVAWYNVRHPQYGLGWVHGNYVTECDANGAVQQNSNNNNDNNNGNSNNNNNSGNNSGNSSAVSTDGQPEASYNTLMLGSSGAAVKNLVTELKNQGYFTGSIVSQYNTAVQEAVRKFQEKNGLTVDGIAGSATQHKLYGTVPIGSGDKSNLAMTLYPAEKIDWYTGGINELWAKGDNYKIYDVYTGIVWWAHRWSGGLHVDAEPLTAADTARLCKIYGVNSSQEIKDKDLWQRRPCLVTIGTRTFACSLYGVPHNYPAGDTIANNDYKGQLCIHFTNSKIHDSQKVDSLHQAAIEYAWLNAPNGHK